MNSKQHKRDLFYIDVAKRAAEESYAVRRKVGACIVNDDNIISYGWNGMPANMPNICEDEIDGVLVTKPECRHAEFNAIAKLAKKNGGAANSTMYVTLSPCTTCANLINASGITRVVFSELYRDTTGIDLLKNTFGIQVDQI